MTNYVHQWTEDQFQARVERLSRNGYISRMALRELMDNQLATPAMKSIIRESLSNHLSKQTLHLKYDLGIGRRVEAKPLHWNSEQFFQQLAALVDKEHYVKNDTQRWTVETISRSSIKEFLQDIRVPEVYLRSLSMYLEQNPCRRIFKLENIETFLRQSVPHIA